MSEVIEKYIKCMKDYIEFLKNMPNLYQMGYKDRIIERKINAINFFESIYSESNKQVDIFNDFIFFDVDLKLLNYTTQEKFEIIVAAIKKNIDLGILQSDIYSVSECSLGELIEAIDRKEFIEAHRIISKYYLAKLHYCEEDIQKIDEALLYLGINRTLRREINNFLTHEYNRREKREEKKAKKNNNIHTNGKYSLNEYYEKQNEKKQIIEELNNYFDYEKMQAIRPLLTQEKTHCIKLLEMIGCKKEEQLQFLKMMEAYPIIYSNPIAQYADNYEKLKYYEKAYGLQEYLNRINEYLEFTFICSDEEYVGWKNEIKNELTEIMQLLPKSYEYELSKNKIKTK